MRITVDIDDDVLLTAKDLARRVRKSTGAVLSELARKGLNGAPASGENSATGTSFYGFRPWPKRGTPVTNESIDRLRDDDPY